MSEWKKTRLGEMLKVKKGQAITKREAHPGPYPVILGGQEPAYYIDRFNHTGKAIVISRSGASAGFVSFWDEPIFVTDGFLIEPKDNCSIEFLFYSLKNKQGQLHNLQRGSAIPHVTPALLGEVETFLPPRPIQDRIAGILSEYDSAIANCRKQIALLEEAAMRLYREWFKDGKGEKKRLGDVCDIRYGKPHKDIPDGTIPIYGSAGIMRYGNRAKYTGESVLIPRKGTLDNIMYVDDPFWVVDTMFYTHFKIEHMAKLTFFQLVSLKMSNMNTGTAVPSMTTETLNELMVIVPSETSRERFDKQISALYSARKSLNRQIRTFTEARDRLLPKLMKGEIAV